MYTIPYMHDGMCVHIYIYTYIHKYIYTDIHLILPPLTLSVSHRTDTQYAKGATSHSNIVLGLQSRIRQAQQSKPHLTPRHLNT